MPRNTLSDSLNDRQIHQEQVTSFQDDVADAVYHKPLCTDPKDWISIAGDSGEHTIKDILSRPVQIIDGLLSSLDTSEVVIGTFPNAIIGSSDMVRTKLSYFEYFRADIHIRFMANAMPFQAGRYWLYFSPYDTESNRGRTGFVQNMTGYPGVEIDLASSAPVELVIPYCAPLSHYNLVTAESTMGEAILFPIAPVASGTSPDTVPFSIFAWFENIDLVLPTSKRLSTNFVAQAFQGEESGENIISGIKSVATGALQKIVPLPPSWMAKAVQGVSSLLGFNKPRSEESGGRFANHPGKDYTTVDASDNSALLGATRTNLLNTPTGLFSTSVDEMSIDYVKKKSCMYKPRRSWHTTDQVGALLDTIPVHPGYCGATAPNELAHPTTLAYLASMFRYWRGGITYRYSFSKTAFHSGRLRFSFIPRVPITSNPVDIGDHLFETYNWVIDLSQSSEITFTIPYCSNRAWMPVEVIPANAQTAHRETSIGWLSIQVLTPLKTSSLTATSVEYLGWISGADDMEFAVPDFAEYVPSNLTPALDFEAQILQEAAEGIEHNEQVSEPTNVILPRKMPPPLSPDALCMGERINSLRQLIKRFGPMWIGYPAPYKRADGAGYSVMGPLPANNTSEQYSLNSITLDPAYFGELTTDSSAFVLQDMPTIPGSTPGAAPAETASCIVGRKLPATPPLHYISYLFRFYRGGRRYKIWTSPSKMPVVSSQSFSAPLPDPGGSQDPPSNWLHGCSYAESRSTVPYVVTRNKGILANGELFGPTAVAGYRTTQQSVFESINYPDLNGCVEVEVPYYAGIPISLVAEGELNNTQGPLVERSTINFTLGSTLEDLETPWIASYANASNFVSPPWCARASIGSCRVYTAAADDFSFGYLVGAPNLIRSLF